MHLVDPPFFGGLFAILRQTATVKHGSEVKWAWISQKMCGKKMVPWNHSGSSSELVVHRHFLKKISSLFPCLPSGLKPGSCVFHCYSTISAPTYETALARKQVLVPFELMLPSWISAFYTTYRSHAEESLGLVYLWETTLITELSAAGRNQLHMGYGFLNRLTCQTLWYFFINETVCYWAIIKGS